MHAEPGLRDGSAGHRLLGRPPVEVMGAGALTAIAVVAIAYFDFGPALAFNDDYAYAWSSRHLGGAPIYPGQTALALPQIVVGWLLAAPFAHDQRALRASVLVLILPGVWAAYRLARRLGAGPAWGLLSPVVMLTSPIFFNLAVSFMSDVAYVSLLLVACNAGVAWLEGGRGRAGFGAWSALATLQRAFGIALAPAMAVALALGARQRRRALSRPDVAWLATAFLGSLVALVVPGLLGVSAGVNVADRLSHIQPDALFTPLVHLPMVAGFLLLPLAGALRIRWTVRLALFAVPAMAVVIVLIWKFPWLPGNIWTFVGPAPTLAGKKPPSMPLVLDLVLIGVCPVVFWLLGPAAIGRWVDAGRSDPRFVFLLTTSALQLLFLLPNTLTLYDRYYLPVVAPLIPMLCALAQRHARPGAAVLAGAACVFLLGVALVNEQDYQSWQSARDHAARLAYLCAEPARVNAGYEANAVYFEIPEYERTGRAQLGRLARDRIIFGPPNPDLWLEFAGPQDPRPGVPYGSIDPGKVVLNGAVCGIWPDASR